MAYLSLFTIGHSTRPLAVFVELCKEYRVEAVADVRSVPRSRRNPQFNKTALSQDLTVYHINYSHFAELGGFRKPDPHSVNVRWNNPAFRGYADYMQTVAFQEGLARLLAFASTQATAVMCAEAVPWRCHRFLIADACAAQGAAVTHILAAGKSMSHAITEGARVENGIVTYP